MEECALSHTQGAGSPSGEDLGEGPVGTGKGQVGEGRDR